jgi:hypothetical protein
MRKTVGRETLAMEQIARVSERGRFLLVSCFAGMVDLLSAMLTNYVSASLKRELMFRLLFTARRESQDRRERSKTLSAFELAAGRRSLRHFRTRCLIDEPTACTVGLSIFAWIA